MAQSTEVTHAPSLPRGAIPWRCGRPLADDGLALVGWVTLPWALPPKSPSPRFTIQTQALHPIHRLSPRSRSGVNPQMRLQPEPTDGAQGRASLAQVDLGFTPGTIDEHDRQLTEPGVDLLQHPTAALRRRHSRGTGLAKGPIHAGARFGSSEMLHCNRQRSGPADCVSTS